ncbi:MAG: MFS transporter [Bacteroidia bacterium]
MLKNERFLLFTLAAINFTNIVDFMVMMPLETYLTTLYHITHFQFSILVASYTLSAGLSGYTAALIIDRFDRKTTLQIVFAGFLLGTLLCGVAQGYYLLLAARIVTGIFGGLLGSIVMAIAADVIPIERRGAAMGIITTGFSMASIAGVPLGLYLATLTDWHAPFLFLVLVGLVISPLIWKYVPNVKSHIQEKSDRPDFATILKEILVDRNHFIALTLMVGLMLGHFCIVPTYARYMEDNVGFSKDQVTLIYFIGGLFTFFTSPIVGRLADKYGKKKVFSIFIVLCSIPVLFITHMGHIPLIPAFVVTTLFFVFSSGRFIPAQAMVTGAVNPKIRGGFMSFASASQQVAAGVAALISGLIVVEKPDGTLGNYNYIGYVSVVITMSLLLLVPKLVIREQKTEQVK